jgi:tripartite-type tricarboxylate transporter receptor subunit TctC
MTTTRIFDRRTRRHCLSAMLAACATVSMGLLAQPASAEDYPTRPVRVITPFAPGSGPDSVIRLVGERLTQVWGQQVVVDNRPGGNGFIAIGAAAKAEPDGYTLVQVDDTHMALQPHLYKKIPYDIATDFDPIGTLFRVNFFVVVPSNSPWKTMGDLIDTARKEPGYVTYGSWFTGSPGHLGAAMLEAATGTQMVHVPYKQASDLYIGVGNGDVNWAFGSAGSAGAMYRAGKVRYLAVAAPERSSGYPDVPTVQEAGGPADLEVKAWVALLAPHGTPEAVVEKINQDLKPILALPEIRERFTAFGFEPYASTPVEVTKTREDDLKHYGDIVARTNISIQ